MKIIISYFHQTYLRIESSVANKKTIKRLEVKVVLTWKVAQNIKSSKKTKSRLLRIAQKRVNFTGVNTSPLNDCTFLFFLECFAGTCSFITTPVTFRGWNFSKSTLDHKLCIREMQSTAYTVHVVLNFPKSVFYNTTVA